MKKLIALILTCTMALGLASCGQTGTSKSEWTDADLTFTGAENSITVEADNAFIVYDEVSYLTSHLDSSYEEFDQEYVTSRGLALDMSIEEFKDLYTVKNGYAVWEVYDEAGYTRFEEYSNQLPSEMLEDYTNVWIDLGFEKDGDRWKVLTDVEVQDIWFCDANLDDYEEVVIFCINFDMNGDVVGISMDHLNYNDNFVTYQAWEE